MKLKGVDTMENIKVNFKNIEIFERIFVTKELPQLCYDNIEKYARLKDYDYGNTNYELFTTVKDISKFEFDKLNFSNDYSIIATFHKNYEYLCSEKKDGKEYLIRKRHLYNDEYACFEEDSKILGMYVNYEVKIYIFEYKIDDYKERYSYRNYLLDKEYEIGEIYLEDDKETAKFIESKELRFYQDFYFEYKKENED